MKISLIIRCVFVSTIALIFTGCPEEASEPRLGGAISVNISGCLGPDGLAAGCRSNLNQLDTQSGPVNTCIVFQDSVTGETQTQPARWELGRLTAGSQDPVIFRSGSTLLTSVFFMARAGLPPLCDRFIPNTPCNAVANCALRLGPVTSIINDLLPTNINLRTSGLGCQPQASATSGIDFRELCDGFDNDCDGETDELQNLAIESCEFGTASCTLPGHLSCNAGEIICVADSSPAEECNGIDDDCDGQIDENANCVRCEGDGDCLQDPQRPVCNVATGECRQCLNDGECGGGVCIMSTGACGACIPTTNRGCTDPVRPACSSNGAQCQPCETNAECARYDDQSRRVCIGGRCGLCDPSDLRQGCSQFRNQPICDTGAPGDEPCRVCNQDSECGPAGSNAICLLDSGTCTGCDPATHRGCSPDGDRPICDGNTLTCVGCSTAGNQCGEINNGNTPFCDEEEGCGECLNTTSEGCVESSNTPFCANRRCRSCSTNDECNRRDGRLNYCGLPMANLNANLIGACISCDAISQEGCTPAEPICGTNGRCRTCREGDRCPNGDICVDGSCVNCNPLDNRGCSNGGPGTPICNEQEQCDRCEQDAECNGVWAADGLRECVEGRCAECSPNDPIPCAQSTAGCVEVFNGPHVCGVCRDNADCGPGRLCAGGRCGQCDPNDPGTCPGQAEACDPGLLICIEQGCLNDADCPGEICVDRQCQACNPDTHRGCEAQIDNRPGRCLDGQSCVGCLDSRDCSASADFPNVFKVCSEATNRCVSCQTDNQCSNAFDGELIACVNRKCRLCRNSAVPVDIEDTGCFEPYTRCLDLGTKCCMPDDEGGECLTERPD